MALFTRLLRPLRYQGRVILKVAATRVLRRCLGSSPSVGSVLTRSASRLQQQQVSADLPRCFFSLSSSLSLRDPDYPKTSLESESSTEAGTSSKYQWEADASLLDDIEGLDVDTVIETVDKGFQFTKFYEVFPSAVQSLLEYVHTATGLPWWLNIVVCTVAARTCMIPLMLYMKKVNKRLAVIQPKLMEYKDLASMHTTAGDYVRARETHQKMMNLYKEHNVRPFLMILPMIGQMVLFASFFFCLRSMTTAGVPSAGLTTEGVLWFTDLTLPDCYKLLPIINGANIAASLQVGDEANVW